ncbi:MAG: leucine-rich repeat protein [Candidatus Lokiarchaeota archaeon]|nr:leucine-rich repeat protein [Candidatus Lokiarchaeota archaeon]
MTEIALEYGTEEGQSRVEIFDSSTREISLSMHQISSVDLAPVRHLTKLKSIDLSENSLHTIDLQPISSCLHIENLSLACNQLECIDLDPLRDCTNLRVLRLDFNLLEQVDLNPLGFLESLEVLRLGANKLQSVNLNSLANCESLVYLSLWGNKLRFLNLGSLSACVALEEMYLSQNRLKVLDFSPLSTCSSLRKIGVSRNQLQEIDLHPLGNCAHLQELNLSKNALQSLDIDSLWSCKQLEMLNISENDLDQIDITSLILCNNFRELYLDMDTGITLLSRATFEKEEIHIASRYPTIIDDSHSSANVSYDTPIQIQNLDIIKGLAPILQLHEPKWKTFHSIQCMPTSIGLDGLGLLDINFHQFHSLLKESDISALSRRLIQAFCEQVENNGTTIGLDIENFGSKNSEISRIIPRIVKLRRREMLSSGVIAYPNHNKIDLRHLWLTAYGCSILSRRSIGIYCTESEFKCVSEAVENTGFEVRIAYDESELSTPTEMSRLMKQYIWKIAELSSSYLV